MLILSLYSKSFNDSVPKFLAGPMIDSSSELIVAVWYLVNKIYFPSWWIKNLCILIPQSGNAIWLCNFGKVFLVLSAVWGYLKPPKMTVFLPLSCRPEKMIWHGSSGRGHRQMDNYCETWRAGDRAVTGLASSLQAGQLLQQTSSSCSSSYIVLCIENSYMTQSKK